MGKRRPVSKPGKGDLQKADPTSLRIIGGRLRGSKIMYTGERRTRPMKDRTREAIFDLLGPSIRGLHAVDLFAGTGALGLEALSRGAEKATFLERHFPTAALIRQNIQSLGLEDFSSVVAGDTFFWGRQPLELGTVPWAVFCSPPYDLYVDQTADLVQLLTRLQDEAPSGSLLVVEADRRFDCGQLPTPESWDIRHYPPAVVGLHKKP